MMARRGIAVMLLSTVLFSLMSATVRGVHGVNSYTLVMGRFVVGALVVAGLFVAGIEEMRWTNWPWLVARGVCGGFACVIFYWTIQNLGLARAVTLNYTYVIFAAILAVPLLGERVDAKHWLAILAASAGVALLCGVQRLSVSSGDLVGLGGALLSGLAVVSVTRCRDTDTSGNIFWSQSLFGIAIVAIPTVRNWAPPTPREWALLVAIGLLAAGGQLAMTYAYKYTGAAHGSLLSLATPVISAAIGILYYGERQTASFFVGGTLILISCVYLSLNPVRRAVKSVAADLECGSTPGATTVTATDSRE